MATNYAAKDAVPDLFDLAPISLWEDGYSAVKAYLDGLRASGVTDFRAYVAEQPEVPVAALQHTHALNVNRPRKSRLAVLLCA